MKNKLNWIDFNFEIKNKNFTTELFKNKLNIFWKEIMENKLNENQHIWLLFRLEWTNGQFVTIGKLVKLNKEDKDYLYTFIINNMDDKSEYYKEEALKAMMFSYSIKKGRAKEKVTLDSNPNLQYQNFHYHKLPITMNPLEYGNLIRKIGNIFIIQINKTNIVDITQYEDKNEVKFFRESKEIYTYTDHKIDENTFVRYIENKQYTYKNNELILLTIDKSTKFIKPLLQQDKLNEKFISMDIETYIKDGVHIPYCICWYDKIESYSYYIKDYKSSKDMIINCIKDIMIKKYDNYKVYLHNLSGFDGIFLLKILVELGLVKPLIHDRKIISISFKYNNYDITLKDSLHLLITSLKKLGKSFGIDTQKSIFPHKFVNENNLDYIGQVPDFKYFDNITLDEYNKYKANFNNNWNLKDESIKYCKIDCISLYQIISKFSFMIFDLFKINTHKYPTLSSLAFALFRTLFINKDTIPQLSGQIAKDIRDSYTGGAVDMYIPRPPKGVKIFGYDVNALYPYVMKEYDMPTGKPVLFQGNIRAIDPNAFGFFYCKIIAPNNLKHPILQTHVKTKSGYRTMAPLGSWNDMIFSAEMDNAMKYGYKFEILWGYKFKPKNIFNGYVNLLYPFRLKFPKSNPLNYIAKLLLNSLYGRFGMDDAFSDITIFNNKMKLNKFLKQHSDSDILDIMELGNKFLVKHRFEEKNEKTMLYGNLETHNVSIGIAAAITAYARIHMSQFKNNPNFILYYSDTDSIYIDRPLPDYLVSDTILGKMKLECILTDAIFLAPKVYYLETEDDNIIYKVKGLKHEVKLIKNDFENLLMKLSKLEKFQNKWIVPKGFYILLLMNLLILILIWLFITYNINGIYSLFQLIVCMINIFITTIFIGLNPDMYFIHLIRLLSIIIIVMIIFQDLKQLLFLFI